MDECKPLGTGGDRSTQRGWAVQVDPIQPQLKPPGSKRLKLRYEELLSNFAFKFNLRCYNGVQLEGCKAPMVRRCRLTL